MDRRPHGGWPEAALDEEVGRISNEKSASIPLTRLELSVATQASALPRVGSEDSCPSRRAPTGVSANSICYWPALGNGEPSRTNVINLGNTGVAFAGGGGSPTDGITLPVPPIKETYCLPSI